ncbi:hypothetical protein D0Y65_010698 [Glycine soja]|uniref:Uncharacterized protein n=1 Tax=Glycine soja TaxID=3848 RepID=A0A445L4S9_GLYSO|nr:hypothetical protein D0Y65_010698 [Glycine soja]
MEKKVHVGMGSVHRTRPASNRKDSFPPSRGSIKRKIFIFICGKIRQRILAYMVSST